MSAPETIYRQDLLRFELIPMLSYLIDPYIVTLIVLVVFIKYTYTKLRVCKPGFTFAQIAFKSIIVGLSVLLAVSIYKNYTIDSLIGQTLLAVLVLWVMLAVYYAQSSLLVWEYWLGVWMFVYLTALIGLLGGAAQYYNDNNGVDYNLLQYLLLVAAKHALACTFIRFSGSYTSGFITALKLDFQAYREGRLNVLISARSMKPTIKLIALLCLFFVFTLVYDCPSYMLTLAQLSLSLELSDTRILENKLEPQSIPKWRRRGRQVNLSLPNFVALYTSFEVWRLMLSGNCCFHLAGVLALR